MVLFAIKLIKNIRKAIAGRNHPHQMAWAVGLGVLLGIIPHGNLVALAVLLVILVTQINHAMAAVTTIIVTFVASSFDPVSNKVGSYMLTNETTGPMVAQAWQWPLVPWTDLNNTIVMGSFVIGLCALLPIVLMTYPIFKWLSSPELMEDDPTPTDNEQSVMVDEGHASVPAPHFESSPKPMETTYKPHISFASDSTDAEPVITSVDQYLATEQENFIDETEQVSTSSEEDETTVDTRIDVIRMTDYRNVSDINNEADAASDKPEDEQPMDEALNYLLRQLRDSQQRKAG